MSKYRQAAKCDTNQPAIVKALRKIPGVSVAVNHDDILCGRNGKTYWFELKDPAKTLKKNGELRKGALKDSQIDLRDNWTGHFCIAWTLEMILKEIGIG